MPRLTQKKQRGHKRVVEVQQVEMGLRAEGVELGSVCQSTTEQGQDAHRSVAEVQQVQTEAESSVEPGKGSVRQSTAEEEGLAQELTLWVRYCMITLRDSLQSL